MSNTCLINATEDEVTNLLINLLEYKDKKNQKDRMSRSSDTYKNAEAEPSTWVLDWRRKNHLSMNAFSSVARNTKLYKECPHLSVVPVVLKTGYYAGKTALMWPSGSYIHNDISYQCTASSKKIHDIYEHYTVSKKNRINAVYT